MLGQQCLIGQSNFGISQRFILDSIVNRYLKLQLYPLDSGESNKSPKA
jgi:hypothetical protein